MTNLVHDQSRRSKHDQGVPLLMRSIRRADLKAGVPLGSLSAGKSDRPLRQRAGIPTVASGERDRFAPWAVEASSFAWATRSRKYPLLQLDLERFPQKVGKIRKSVVSPLRH